MRPDATISQISDLAVTLTPQPSEPNQFMHIVNYIINEVWRNSAHNIVPGQTRALTTYKWKTMRLTYPSVGGDITI